MINGELENQTENTPHNKSLLGNIRRWFLAGILLSAPVFLTTYITWIAIDLIDTQVVNLLPKELVVFISSWVPGFGIVPGYGIIIGFILMSLVGRGIRFFIVASLTKFFGMPALLFLQKNLLLSSSVLGIAIILFSIYIF